MTRLYTTDDILNIETKTAEKHRQKINQKIETLHNLRSKLEQEKKNILQEQGYEIITIEDTEFYVPNEMSFQQFYTYLQNRHIIPDQESSPIQDHVRDKHLQHVKSDLRYQEIIQQREQIINEINEIYKTFWTEHIQPKDGKDIQKIATLLFVFEKNINTNVLSNVTNIPQHICKKITYDEQENVVRYNDGNKI